MCHLPLCLFFIIMLVSWTNRYKRTAPRTNAVYSIYHPREDGCSRETFPVVVFPACKLASSSVLLKALGRIIVHISENKQRRRERDATSSLAYGVGPTWDSRKGSMRIELSFRERKIEFQNQYFCKKAVRTLHLKQSTSPSHRFMLGEHSCFSTRFAQRIRKWVS